MPKHVQDVMTLPALLLQRWGNPGIWDALMALNMPFLAPELLHDPFACCHLLQNCTQQQTLPTRHDTPCGQTQFPSLGAKGPCTLPHGCKATD